MKNSKVLLYFGVFILTLSMNLERAFAAPADDSHEALSDSPLDSDSSTLNNSPNGSASSESLLVPNQSPELSGTQRGKGALGKTKATMIHSQSVKKLKNFAADVHPVIDTLAGSAPTGTMLHPVVQVVRTGAYLVRDNPVKVAKTWLNNQALIKSGPEGQESVNSQASYDKLTKEQKALIRKRDQYLQKVDDYNSNTGGVQTKADSDHVNRYSSLANSANMELEGRSFAVKKAHQASLDSYHKLSDQLSQDPSRNAKKLKAELESRVQKNNETLSTLNSSHVPEIKAPVNFEANPKSYSKLKNSALAKKVALESTLSAVHLGAAGVNAAAIGVTHGVALVAAGSSTADHSLAAIRHGINIKNVVQKSNKGFNQFDPSGKASLRQPLKPKDYSHLNSRARSKIDEMLKKNPEMTQADLNKTLKRSDPLQKPTGLKAVHQNISEKLAKAGKHPVLVGTYRLASASVNAVSYAMGGDIPQATANSIDAAKQSHVLIQHALVQTNKATQSAKEAKLAKEKQVQAAKLAKEKQSEWARLVKEKRAEVARVAKEKQAELARVNKVSQARTSRRPLRSLRLIPG